MSDALRSASRRSVAQRPKSLHLTTPALPPEAAAVIGRFPARIRRKVTRLYLSSARIADLATVYPGLLAALAARRGSPRNRIAALRMIEGGAPLKSAARVLNMPMWLRRLPPEAFVRLPPALPQSESFAKRITARLPRDRDDAAFWLDSVLFAERACGEDFAIWLAGQAVFQDGAPCEAMFPILAAYAWFSKQAETEGHRYIVAPWRSEISFETALCAAKSWFNRVRLVLQLPPGTIDDCWLKPGTVNGFTFVPLLDHAEIFSEAQAMQNCADQFAERLALGTCRLFSVRKVDQRVATLEIAQHEREVGILSIRQLKARHNMPAGTDVWQAAYCWLARQDNLRRIPQLMSTRTMSALLDQSAWQRILQPYRDATGGAPWLDDAASDAQFSAFDQQMADLSRRGGVSSWLFT